MNILIVGGTRFQGRHLVGNLLERGHTVTVFHRGSHMIAPQEGLTDLIGSRDNPTDLARIAGTRFDACIDTCAYFPAQVDLLAGYLRTDHYSLISTVHVYKDHQGLLAENASLDMQPIPAGTQLSPQNYGALKVMCEARARLHFGRNCLLIRPSIIIGPGDHTERMSFWMRMIGKHCKRITSPAFDRPLQLLDVRDLAQFTTSCVENTRQGEVNVCGEVTTLNDVQLIIAEFSEDRCTSGSIRSAEIPETDTIELPYLDRVRNCTYDRHLSFAWGFAGRPLTDSLHDICRHEVAGEFAMRGFRQEEAAILQLFP